MPPAKPALGYSSRSEAVIALRRRNLSTDEIARQLGITTSIVTALEHSAMRSRTRQVLPASQHGRTVLFPIDVLDRLQPHAAKRGIHANHLARLIVETAVDEDMIDAILDDREELPS